VDLSAENGLSECKTSYTFLSITKMAAYQGKSFSRSSAGSTSHYSKGNTLEAGSAALPAPSTSSTVAAQPQPALALAAPPPPSQPPPSALAAAEYYDNSVLAKVMLG